MNLKREKKRAPLNNGVREDRVYKDVVTTKKVCVCVLRGRLLVAKGGGKTFSKRHEQNRETGPEERIDSTQR